MNPSAASARSAPLTGVRVLDVTVAGAGPRAASLLAGLGADVVRVEAPGDMDIMRTRPPTQRGFPIGYLVFNRGKKSISLDLKSRRDRDIFDALVRQSDVFVCSLSPRAIAGLRLGEDEISALRPGIVCGYISAWGDLSAFSSNPGTDPLVQFLSGWASIQGKDDSSPELGRGVGLIDEAAGVLLVGGILSRLLWQTGYGTEADGSSAVRMSLLEASLAMQSTRFAEGLAGAAARPLGSSSATVAPDCAFRCADEKYLAVTASTQTEWRSLCDALGLADRTDDALFATNEARVRNRDQLLALLNPTFASQPSNWWCIVLCRGRVPHGYFYDWETIRHHTHIEANGLIPRRETPYGPVYLARQPWLMDSISQRDLPLTYPDGDRAEILGLAQAGGVRSEPAATESGLVALDFSQGIAGSYATFLLQSLGAEVIKVTPRGADITARHSQSFADECGAAYHALNDGKRHLRMSFSEAQDLAALRAVLRDVDVIVEDGSCTSAGPAEAEFFKSALRDNPGLVVAHVCAFGHHGPLRGRPASELVLQATSETCAGLGRPGEPPVRIGADIASLLAGSYLLTATLAALVQVRRDGRDDAGQQVSVSAYACLIHARASAWASETEPDEWDGWAARTYWPPNYGYTAKDGLVFIRGHKPLNADVLELLDTLEVDTSGLDRGVLTARDWFGLGKHAAELAPRLNERLVHYGIEELQGIFGQRNFMVSPLLTHTNVLADPDLAGRISCRRPEEPGWALLAPRCMRRTIQGKLLAANSRHVHGSQGSKVASVLMQPRSRAIPTANE